MGRGNPGVRRAAVVVLALDTLAAGFAVATIEIPPAESAIIVSVVGTAVVIQLAVLLWLWRSSTGREFFLRRDGR